MTTPSFLAWLLIRKYASYGMIRVCNPKVNRCRLRTIPNAERTLQDVSDLNRDWIDSSSGAFLRSPPDWSIYPDSGDSLIVLGRNSGGYRLDKEERRQDAPAER